jgi:flagellar protein FliO/FliZ
MSLRRRAAEVSGFGRIRPWRAERGGHGVDIPCVANCCGLLPVLRAAVACGGGLLAMAALAVDDTKIIFPGATHADSPAAGAGGGLGSITLIIGLALAAVGAWFVWRGRNGLSPSREARALAVTETRSLGNRQYLVVASYENKKFLLGVCPGRIDLLAPLHDSAGREKSD